MKQSQMLTHEASKKVTTMINYENAQIYFVCLFSVHVRERADQDWRSHEEVIEGVVQQVDAGGGVKICITHQLAGKQCLSGAAAQEASHLAIGHVHPVGQHLQTQTIMSAKPHGQSVTRQGNNLRLTQNLFLVSCAIMHDQSNFTITLKQCTNLFIYQMFLI